jgi:arylsulfatase
MRWARRWTRAANAPPTGSGRSEPASAGRAMPMGLHLILTILCSVGGFFGGGIGALAVDGKVVATKKLARSAPLSYNLDDTFCIATSTDTPLDGRDYKAPFPFTGKLNKLTIAVEEPKLTPEDLKKLKEAKRKQD